MSLGNRKIGSLLSSLLNSLVSSDDSHASAMKKAGFSLALFAFISVFFVSITNSLTANKIAENQTLLLLRALNEIVPKESYDNDLIASKTIINKTTPNKDISSFMSNTPVYLATNAGEPVTAIFEVTTNKGYSGAITLLVGVNAPQQTISGVRVVKHKETPGLGDKMEIKKTPPNKTPWVLDFNDKSLNNPQLSAWNVKKDNGEFDQFTGATITPRAIVNAVKSTLLYARDNMDALFAIETQSVLGNPLNKNNINLLNITKVKEEK